jgi:hypothetical protein
MKLPKGVAVYTRGKRFVGEVPDGIVAGDAKKQVKVVDKPGKKPDTATTKR